MEVLRNNMLANEKNSFAQNMWKGTERNLV